jgi:hypothetical protein
MSFRELQEFLHAKKSSLPFLNVLEDFNNSLMLINFFKAFKSWVSELGILGIYTWKFPGISYFSDLRQTRCARKIPKPVLKTTLMYYQRNYVYFGKKNCIFLESLN